MSADILFANNPAATLASSISPTDTSLTVASGGGLFPSPTGGDYIVITLISATNPNIIEIIHSTARTSNTFTIERAQEGTTALSWNIGDLVQMRVTAGVLSTFQQYPFNQPASNKFFTEDGAVVNRINDRLFVGGATVADGAYPQVTNDWLSAFYDANGYTGHVLEGQIAVLNNNSPDAGFGAQFASHSLNFTSAATSSIGVSTVAVNDNATLGTYAWGLYVEGHNMNTTVEGTYGAEIDIRNLGNSVQADPYQQGINHSTCLQLAAGAGVSATGQANATAALSVQKNPLPFNTGIIFGSDSINGATGTSGSGIAIALGLGHMLQWYGATGIKTGYVVGEGTTNAAQVGLTLGDYIATFEGSSSNIMFQTAGADNTVNYIKAASMVTGSAPVLSAHGSDTSVGLTFQVKGNGSPFLFVDDSGYGQFQINPVASAASYVSITAAATGSNPQIASTGTSDLQFQPGSGYIKLATVGNGTVATAMSSVGPTGSHTTIQEWLAIKNNSGVVRYIPLF